MNQSYQKSPNEWYARAHKESTQAPLNPPQRERELQGFVPVLDAAGNEYLTRFCKAKGISLGALTIMGAQVNGPAIAFSYSAGVKVRNMETGERKSHGRFMRHPLNIFYGREPYVRVVLSESETDAGALIDAYPEADVAVMPLGAGENVWSDIWTAQLEAYVIVHVATDADEAGEQSWQCLRATGLPVRRHKPPEGAKDWAEYLQAPNGAAAAAPKGGAAAATTSAGEKP